MNYTKTIILATRNKDKIREIKQALKGLGLEFLSLEHFPEVPQVVEDLPSLEENAIKKAREVSRYTGLWALADDSGLEVDFLNGAPGVYSSRFAGEGATYAENNQKLLRLMKGVPPKDRTARFRCVIALAFEDQLEISQGTCEGFITEEPKGDNGFGYDPIFYVPEVGKTLAEMDLELKTQISHRGKALQEIRNVITFRRF